MEVLRKIVGVAHGDEEEEGEGPPGTACIQKAYRALSERVDKRNGGFGSAPKFPQPGTVYSTFVCLSIMLERERSLPSPPSLYLPVSHSGLSAEGVCSLRWLRHGSESP